MLKTDFCYLVLPLHMSRISQEKICLAHRWAYSINKNTSVIGRSHYLHPQKPLGQWKSNFIWDRGLFVEIPVLIILPKKAVSCWKPSEIIFKTKHAMTLKLSTQHRRSNSIYQVCPNDDPSSTFYLFVQRLNISIRKSSLSFSKKLAIF